MAADDAAPAARPDRAQRILLADLARAYYLDNQSKVELATQFGVSRFQIARLLEEARTAGVVRIEIEDPRRPRTVLEGQLATRLRVAQVLIVEDQNDGIAHIERVGAAVLGRLAEAVRPGMTVGLSWSRTLDSAARSLRALPPSTIVQLTGAFQTDSGGTFTKLMLELDQRSGITTFPLYAPLLVDQTTTAADLRRQPIIAETLAKAGALDLAVVAIGAWGPAESSVWDHVSDEVHEACLAQGVVAEFSGLFIDREGTHVKTPLDGRTIGVAFEQLQQAKQVIGFARGRGRAEAVLAAARTGLFDSLIVDAPLADAICSLPPDPEETPE